jgi:hypothetical protein
VGTRRPLVDFAGRFPAVAWIEKQSFDPVLGMGSGRLLCEVGSTALCMRCSLTIVRSGQRV